MKSSHFYNNNKGSAMLIMAAALTVILSVGALVLDIGNVILERQNIQNAMDSASLAAAYELPDTDKAEETALYYAQKNGMDPENVTVTFNETNTAVKVTTDKTVYFFLAKVLGYKGVDTETYSVAEMGSIGEAFNYTLFSGSKNDALTMNGSQMSITGSSHSNKNFIANGSKLTITGACEAVTTITVNGSNININNRLPNSPVIEMPDFSEILRLQAEKAGQVFIGNKTFNGSNINIDAPLYVDGNVTVNGSRFSGKGCVLATGNITFNGSNLNASTSDAVCFYSKSGNITVNGSNAQLDGIIYAPNGSIIMNGSNQTVHGRIIGRTLIFNGSNLNIVGGTTELGSLPSRGVRLVD